MVSLNILSSNMKHYKAKLCSAKRTKTPNYLGDHHQSAKYWNAEVYFYWNTSSSHAPLDFKIGHLISVFLYILKDSEIYTKFSRIYCSLEPMMLLLFKEDKIYLMYSMCGKWLSNLELHGNLDKLCKILPVRKSSCAWGAPTYPEALTYMLHLHL